MQKIYLILIASVCSLFSFSQTTTRTILVPSSRTITATVTKKLNGKINGAFGGTNRDFISITLPSNTYECHYSFTTRNSGALQQNLKLGIQIAGILASVYSGGTAGVAFSGISKVALQAIQTPPGSVPVNAYLLDGRNESNFVNGNSFNCYMSYSITNATQGVGQVPNFKRGPIFLGFENLSNWNGVFIDVEVVVVVLESKTITEVNNSNNSQTNVNIPKINNNASQNSNTTAYTGLDWKSNEANSYISDIRKYVDGLIEADSMNLKSTVSVSNIFDCIMHDLSANVSFTDFANNQSNQKQTVLNYYSECSRQYYFPQADDYIKAKNAGARGWKYFLLGEYDKALEFYNSSVEIQPLCFVKANIGLYYLIKGVQKQAIRAYTQAIQISQNSDEPIGVKKRNIRESVADIERCKTKMKLSDAEEALDMLKSELSRLKRE